jgi:hypothetical protein
MAKRGTFDTLDLALFTGGVVGGGITGLMCTSSGAATYKLVKAAASEDTTEYEIVLVPGMVLDFPCSWDVTITTAAGAAVSAGKVYVQFMQFYK